MDKEGLAALLDGCAYRNEISSVYATSANDNGLVVVFGASDDLMEFRGAITNELGAWGGTTAYLTKTGLLHNNCEDDYCPYFAKLQRDASTIEAIWDHDGYSWTFNTDIPHATFEVLEDGEKYCRGIVFELDDA